MTLKELNIFFKLCKNSHISKLANSLYVTQSSISLSIKSLEKKIGEQLFDRIGKKLVLNERGRLFKDKTYLHFLALHDAKELFLKDKISGELKVTASKTIANYLMPDIYYSFLKKYKDVKLNISTMNSTNIIRDLELGNLDIGFIESNRNSDFLIKEKLFDDELIVVSSDENYKNECYIDEIDKNWILREEGSGTREIFFENLKDNIKNIDIFMEFYEFEDIKNVLLSHKDCISAVSKLVVQKELNQKQVFEVKIKNIDFKRSFYMIYHKDKFHSVLFSEFKKFVFSKR